MVRKGVRSPWTSSAGRLLDAFSALLGVCRRVSYEGEAAIALEHAADVREREGYPFPLRAVARPPMGERSTSSSGARGAGSGQATTALAGPAVADRPRWTVDWAPALEAALRDVRFGAPPAVVAARVHNGLVEAMATVAERVGHPRVGLSGGCFQNRLLVEGASRSLRARGFEVLLHRRVPPNDGGLALGQVAVAAAWAGRTEGADRAMERPRPGPHPGGGGGWAAAPQSGPQSPHPPDPRP